MRRRVSRSTKFAVLACVVPGMAESLNKTVKVSYLPILAHGPGPLSETLNLQVLALPATALSELVILEAANGGAGPELDLSGATTATLRVGVWPLITEGQPMWLSLSGTKSDGSPYSKVIWAAGSSKVNASWVMDGHLSTTLSIAELKQLKDGSALTITFKAGLDGTQTEANAVTFAAKVYTMKAAADIRPVISSVRDSWSEISPGGTTYDNSVTVSGTATASQQVELFDGATSKGNASVDTGGNWSAPLSGLALGTHSITAKGLYGSGLVSAARAFNKAAQTAPVISSVRDSIEELANGSTTPDLTVSISGTATPNTQVEIFDNGAISKGVAQVNAAGNWTHSVSALAAGNHSLTAKALYGSGESSVAWGFVRADVPDWVKEDFELEQIQDFQPYTNVRFRYFSSTTNTKTSIRGPSNLSAPYFSGKYFGVTGHPENSSYYPVNWTFTTPIKSMNFSLHLNGSNNQCQVEFKDSSGVIMARY